MSSVSSTTSTLHAFLDSLSEEQVHELKQEMMRRYSFPAKEEFLKPEIIPDATHSVPVQLKMVDKPKLTGIITEETVGSLVAGDTVYQGNSRIAYTFIRYNSVTKKLFATHNGNKTEAKLTLGALTF